MTSCTMVEKEIFKNALKSRRSVGIGEKRKRKGRRGKERRGKQNIKKTENHQKEGRRSRMRRRRWRRRRKSIITRRS
jgi:hypothetical protein